MRTAYWHLLCFSSATLLVTLAFTISRAETPEKQVHPITSSVQFKKDIQPILDANCVACHQTGGALGGLNLEAGSSYGAIVSQLSTEAKMLRISPGIPKESYLLHKLEGTHLQVGGSGDQMPATGPMDPELIKILRAWISEGAVQN